MPQLDIRKNFTKEELEFSSLASDFKEAMGNLHGYLKNYVAISEATNQRPFGGNHACVRLITEETKKEISNCISLISSLKNINKKQGLVKYQFDTHIGRYDKLLETTKRQLESPTLESMLPIVEQFSRIGGDIAVNLEFRYYRAY